MAREVTLRIGEVAREAGVRTSVLRYYESVGLIEAPLRRSGRRAGLVLLARPGAISTMRAS